MRPAKVVETVMSAIEARDYETALANLTPDCTFAGPVPEPISGEQWIGLHRLLNVGLPDFSFNISKVEEKGNNVHVTIQITGTHTNTLDLTPLGMPKVPATGIKVQLPAEHPVITVRGDKIAAVHVTPVPDGGVPGMLAQLGVKLS